MTTYFVPTGEHPIEAVVAVPASKSITNRALVCAALAEGETVIDGIAPGDDTVAMIRCLDGLGARIELRDEDVAVVRGFGGKPTGPATTLNAGLAGTTSRFVTAMAALGDQPYTIDGAT